MYHVIKGTQVAQLKWQSQGLHLGLTLIPLVLKVRSLDLPPGSWVEMQTLRP